MNDLDPRFSTALHAAFPAEAPSADLMRRITTPRAVHRPRHFLRLAYLGAAITAVAAGSVFVGPRAMAYAELQRIEGAADALPYWHVSSFTPDAKGNFVLSSQTWGQGGMVRDDREFGHSVTFTQGDARITWRPGADHAVRDVTSGRRSMPLTKLSGFIRELQSSTSLLGLTVDSNVEVDGRLATRVTALSKSEPVRTRVYADSQTQIPFLCTIEVQSDQGWKLERRCVIELAQPSVTMTLPEGVRVVNQADLEADMESRYSRPLAKFGSASIRDVWMNKDGVVFVLYTNGRSFKPVDTSKWKEIHLPNGQVVHEGPPMPASQTSYSELLSLTAPGVQYLKADQFQGTMYYTDGRFVKGLRWPDGDAQVAVYIPVVDRPATAKVELTFGQQGMKVPPNFEPHGKWVTTSEMVPYREIEGRYSATLRPSPAELPEWVEQLGMSPQLATEAARIRSQAALQAGNGPEAELQARLYLRLTQMQAAESGMSYAMYGMYEALGRALAVEGKTAEARTAFTKALGDAQGDAAAEIQKELNALPAHP